MFLILDVATSLKEQSKLPIVEVLSHIRPHQGDDINQHLHQDTKHNVHNVHYDKELA